MDCDAIVVDEVHVISDLHLGGEAPFQIFCEGVALTGLIDGLSANPIPLRRALVIVDADRKLTHLQR
jgi:hypothetical protein